MSLGALPSIAQNLPGSAQSSAPVAAGVSPAAPANTQTTTSAGVGTSAPQPGVAPTTPGSVPPNTGRQPSLYERSVQAGVLPPGLNFNSDEELVARLAQVAQQAVETAEAAQRRQPAAPAAAIAPPQQNAVSQDQLNATAAAFQQQGLLTFNNGAWVATNPLAAPVADQLNTRAAQAQARQAELADPESFIRKYGITAFQQQVAPLVQQQQQMQRQIEALQQMIVAQAPKPYDEFLQQHEAVLFAKDPTTGREVPTQAGQVYQQAWDELARTGVRDESALHKYAAAMVSPYLQAAPVVQQPLQPAQPWSANIPPATDPSFSRPGSMVQGAQAPGAGVVPRTNQGLPSLIALVSNPNRPS